MAFFFLFCIMLDFLIFNSLLVGDEFMDVFFLRYLLCLLECFSLLCRCISTFLRMFCNLLSSHFLMLMFCDFIYFFIVFFLFFLLSDLIMFFTISIASLFCVIFYCFLYLLDMFCALLQMFIFCTMIMQLITDFLIFLSFH